MSARSALGGCRLGQESDLALEVSEVLEALIDTGEPDIGHLVKTLESLEYGYAEILSRHDRIAPASQVIFDRLGNTRNLSIIDRSVLAGRTDPSRHLEVVEWLSHSGPLLHDKRQLFDSFEGSETLRTCHALTTATDRSTILGHARVHNPIIICRAEGTTHTLTIPGNWPPQGRTMCSPGTTTGEPTVIRSARTSAA